MLDLVLRPTRIGGDRLADDFCVYQDGRRIGRIRLAENHVEGGLEWRWHVNPPLPVPPWADGSTAGLEQAKAAFRAAWARFSGGLTPASRDHWRRTAEACPWG